MIGPLISHTQNQGFKSDQKGLATTEFALILPVFMTLILGVLDMGHSLYMQSVLQGVVQKAARDSGLETAASDAVRRDAVDAAVRKSILYLNKSAQIDISRLSYKSFGQAEQAAAEPFTDTNSNGVCDAGEPFQDNNDNGHRDATGGDASQGGAKDVVIYEASVSYPRLFPMARLVGMSSTVHLDAKTVLTNQPYGDQTANVATVGYCP
ncbi:hypothetical protein BH10PSE14_BH10PSE14_17760 [soil metagenome]